MSAENKRIITINIYKGAFLVPQDAYWFMTPSAVEQLEKYGIPRKLKTKDKIIIGALMLIVGAGYIATIIFAGRQGVDSGMTLWQLSLRFVIIFWMTSIFDAIVLDWWMFTKTDIFEILIKTKTGKTPAVMRVEPQWCSRFPEKKISKMRDQLSAIGVEYI